MQSQPDSTADLIAVLSAAIAFMSMVISAIMVYFAKRSADDSKRIADAAVSSADAARESVAVSQQALKVSEQAVSVNVEIFKRQGVIALHEVWNDVDLFDPSNLTANDARKVVRATNTLDLMASLWNHEIIEQEILYQSYWGSFRNLYKTIERITKPIPDLGKTGDDLLTADIRSVYQDMDDYEKRRVERTRLSSGGQG